MRSLMNKSVSGFDVYGYLPLLAYLIPRLLYQRKNTDLLKGNYLCSYPDSFSGLKSVIVVRLLALCKTRQSITSSYNNKL